MRLHGPPLLLFFLAACRGAAPPAEVTADPLALIRHGDRLEIPAGSPLAARLVVRAITPENVRRTLETPAQVEADPAHVVRVTPPVPGRVVRLFVQLGDAVRVGQQLVTLDSAEIVEAQTDRLRSESALAQAERTLGRTRDLVQHGIGAQRDLEVAQTEEQLARQDLERSTERLRLLGIGTGRLGRPLTLTAPIAGRVVDMHVGIGEFHSDPSVPLMTIADLETIWVAADVQEKDIRRVRDGAPATVTLTAYPGERWTGQIEFIGEILDPDTRTLDVRVALANADHRLHPGMFATVTFAETVEPLLLVPSTAIVLMGDASYVFVADDATHYRRVRVAPGRAIGERTVVEQGLEPGARVVVENAVLLQ